MDNSLTVFCHGFPITFVIDKGIKQNVFVAICVARCIHGLGNDVDGEVTHVATLEFHAIHV